MEKKLFFATLIALCLNATAIAQGKGKVEFGLNAGYNMSNITDSYGRADTGSGFNVGASADYYFNRAWSIKGKVIYDQKGWNNGSITDLDTGVEYWTDYNLNYLTIPVTANWHFAPTRNWYLNFGPYVGFLLDAKENRFDTDVTDAFHSTDFGLVWGIGVKIPVNDKLKVHFEYEGQGGFTNIFMDELGEDIYNTRSAINVGINFLMN